MPTGTTAAVELRGTWYSSSMLIVMRIVPFGIELDVGHDADLHAGEPHRLPLLHAGAPLEARVQRIA